MFIVSIIVHSNYHMLQFLRQMFNLYPLLLDEALKPVTQLTSIVLNQTLRQLSCVLDGLTTCLLYTSDAADE